MGEQSSIDAAGSRSKSHARPRSLFLTCTLLDPSTRYRRAEWRPRAVPHCLPAMNTTLRRAFHATCCGVHAADGLRPAECGSLVAASYPYAQSSALGAYRGLVILAHVLLLVVQSTLWPALLCRTVGHDPLLVRISCSAPRARRASLFVMHRRDIVPRKLHDSPL
ncbi:hypothetical protein OH77DRAFT_141892 [Trametes cingulata]|nr:hypothetical protein OH77DRAFT_141892 [Trametes cingulata]